MLNISSIYDPLFFDPSFDVPVLYAIIGLVFLSLLSLCFIFHLRLKSRSSRHLQNFNSLWSVRFLLVFVIILWGLSELFRLPIFREQYLNPVLPSLTKSQQESLCKIHVVASLGFFQPGFLVILLFLVCVSINTRTPNSSWVHAFFWSTCIPILVLQILFVFFSMVTMPPIFHRSSVIFKNQLGDEMLLCTYPLMSSIIFGAFGFWYSIFFSLSCFKVVTLVINKGLRARIHALAFSVMIMLPSQIFFLVWSAFLRPEETLFAGFAFLVFITALVLAAVGQGILVIRPIIDSLAAGGDSLRLPSKSEKQEGENDV